MTQLEIRKRLLAEQSDLLRSQLSRDVGEWRNGVKSLGGQARTAAAVLSVAATVAAGISAFRRRHKRSANGRFPLLSTILGGARTASALWQAFHPQQRP